MVIIRVFSLYKHYLYIVEQVLKYSFQLFLHNTDLIENEGFEREKMESLCEIFCATLNNKRQI